MEFPGKERLIYLRILFGHFQNKQHKKFTCSNKASLARTNDLNNGVVDNSYLSSILMAFFWLIFSIFKNTIPYPVHNDYGQPLISMFIAHL